MSDDLKKRGHPDRDLISMKEDWEVEYWTETLMASKETLQDAIDATGSHSVKDIRQYLIDHNK